MKRHVLFLYGPDDGLAETREGEPLTVGVVREHYHLHRIVTDRATGAQTYVYRWAAPRTGLRQPCRAGDERGCGGGRCPSGRSRQTA